MKRKVFLFLFVSTIACIRLTAQGDAMFSALGASLSATTTGFEIELATPLHEKVVLRGGFSFFPYNFDTSIDVRKVNELSLPEDVTVDMEGKINLYNGKILADYFPCNNAFFITGGLYFGKRDIISMEGDSETDLIWGDHIIPSENGRVKATLKINGARPYLGVGFGNAIPNKRVGFRLELGAMFQGTPKLYNTTGEELDDININDKDVIDLVQKFRIYPVVAFRLTGRLF